MGFFNKVERFTQQMSSVIENRQEYIESNPHGTRKQEAERTLAILQKAQTAISEATCAVHKRLDQWRVERLSARASEAHTQSLEQLMKPTWRDVAQVVCVTAICVFLGVIFCALFLSSYPPPLFSFYIALKISGVLLLATAAAAAALYYLVSIAGNEPAKRTVLQEQRTDFYEFIDKFVIKSGFVPKDADLWNDQLHAIYGNFRYLLSAKVWEEDVQAALAEPIISGAAKN